MGLVFKRYFHSETWETVIVFLCPRERCFYILPLAPALGSSAQPFCISRCCNSQTIKVYLYYRSSSWWILLYQLLPFTTPHPEFRGFVCLFSFISRRESYYWLALHCLAMIQGQVGLPGFGAFLCFVPDPFLFCVPSSFFSCGVHHLKFSNTGEFL